MDDIIVILLVIAAVKFVFFGVILFWVFRADIREFWSARRREREMPETIAMPPVPTCPYCLSEYSHPTGEVRTRWEGDELVMVTTFECDHCQFPTWRVERIPMGLVKR